MTYRVTYHFYSITGRENCYYIIEEKDKEDFMEMWRTFKNKMLDTKIEVIL